MMGPDLKRTDEATNGNILRLFCWKLPLVAQFSRFVWLAQTHTSHIGATSTDKWRQLSASKWNCNTIGGTTADARLQSSSRPLRLSWVLFSLSDTQPPTHFVANQMRFVSVTVLYLYTARAVKLVSISFCSRLASKTTKVSAQEEKEDEGPNKRELLLLLLMDRRGGSLSRPSARSTTASHLRERHRIAFSFYSYIVIHEIESLLFLSLSVEMDVSYP